MKYLVLIVFNILVKNSILFGQTIISPIIGIGFSQIENRDLGPGDDYIILTEKGYSNVSPQVGLRIKQRICTNIDIKLTSTFSPMHIKATNNSFADIEGIEFNYFQTSLAVQYIVVPGAYLVGGYSFNHLQGIRPVVERNGDLYKSKESGLVFGIGKMFNRFNLEIIYYNGLTEVEIKAFDLYLKPISSFGITLNYDIKVFDKPGKKVNCPEF